MNFKLYCITTKGKFGGSFSYFVSFFFMELDFYAVLHLELFLNTESIWERKKLRLLETKWLFIRWRQCKSGDGSQLILKNTKTMKKKRERFKRPINEELTSYASQVTFRN